MSQPRPRLPDGAVLARYVLWSVVVGASLGVGGGLAEGIALYPVASWAAVALYLGCLAAIGSALLGLVAGSVALLARRRR